jgi:hypothetical protein
MYFRLDIAASIYKYTLLDSDCDVKYILMLAILIPSELEHENIERDCV